MQPLSNQGAACTLARAGWPPDLIPNMVAVGHAESGLNPSAVNRDPAVAGAPPTGWLQVRAFPDRTARWDLADPLQNARAALEVYHSQGLAAWTTYPHQSAEFLPGVQKDLQGWDPSQCGAAPAGAGATVAGTGMLAGRKVDPWGIGQSITDSVSYTGSALGGFGRRIEGAGAVLIGFVVLGAAAAVLGWLFLTETGPGRSVAAAGQKTAAAAVALVPK
jgi:hypothetical protein